MEKGDIYERWYEILLELSENYSNLSSVVTMLKLAWLIDIPVSEILKVEDELIKRSIIPRRVEYDDDRTGYIEEGDNVIRDIKNMLWNVLYRDRREREHKERCKKVK